MTSETLQIIQLILSGIIIPLMGWQLREVITLVRIVSAHSEGMQTLKGQNSELFRRVLELERRVK
jgi:hypothetical protein